MLQRGEAGLQLGGIGVNRVCLSEWKTHTNFYSKEDLVEYMGCVGVQGHDGWSRC